MSDNKERTILVDDHAEDFARNIGGKLQDAIGGMTGETRNMYGQVVDEMRDFTANRPLGALLAAMGLGVMVGFLVAQR